MARNEHKKVLQQLSEAYGRVYKEGALGSALAGKKLGGEEQEDGSGGRLPMKLSDVNPDVAKAVATGGLKDGDTSDDQIDVDHKPQGIAPVAELKPSQSSMNIEKALGMVIGMLDPNSNLNAGGDLGAFITKDGYIMDGHHRWVATAMVDPSQSVGGYQVDFPAQQLIGILNAMTKGRYGVGQGNPATGSFKEFAPESIKEQLTEYWQNGIGGKFPTAAEKVQEIIQNWTGVQGDAAVDAAVGKMVNNLKGINMTVPDWAPARPDMPVIDGDANVTDAASALERGEVDHAEPHADRHTTGDARRDINRESRSLLRKQLRLLRP